MPIAVPSSDEENIKAIQLYRTPKIGPVAYHYLMENCDSFDEAFSRFNEKASSGRFGDIELFAHAKAEAEYEKGKKLNAHFLHSGGKKYPKLLNDLPDRPPFLWALGHLSLFEKPSIAIIGSRNPTLEGVRMTLHLSKLCNYENIVVVSGLARGIDSSAHEAALTGGTIAVVAGGVDVIYPKSNEKLQELISTEGLVIGEMPFGHPPTSRDFPKRNRIIAGVSMGVLVVEGNLRSGTRLTANDAMRYGRELMAIPGHPFSGLASLPNQLISEGAWLIRDFYDVANAMKLSMKMQENEAKVLPEKVVDKRQIENRREAIEIGRAIIEGRAVQQLDGTVYLVKSLDSAK